jgi:hypothetical protein
MEASMDRKKSKLLVAALATALFGATAYAADSSVSASDPAKGTTSDKATSYDTGKTAPFSGAEGVKTTPPASDEDHNDNGGAPGKPHSKKAHKSSKAAKAEMANDAEHQPTPQPSSSASATGGNAAPAGSDAHQQKSTNGQ